MKLGTSISIKFIFWLWLCKYFDRLAVLRFSQRCCCRLKTSARWHCDIGWVTSDVSKVCSAFIFFDYLALKIKALPPFETSGTTRPATRSHIPEDPNPLRFTNDWRIFPIRSFGSDVSTLCFPDVSEESIAFIIKGEVNKEQWPLEMKEIRWFETSGNTRRRNITSHKIEMLI